MIDSSMYRLKSNNIIIFFFYIFLCEYVLVGQCGNQIGSAFWPLALHEYGIQTTSGGVNLLKVQRNHVKHISDLSDAFPSFFHVPVKTDNLYFENVADLSKAKVKARVSIFFSIFNCLKLAK